MLQRFTAMFGASVSRIAVCTSVSSASAGVATIGKPSPKVP
jgi:hypothetical protein